VNPFRPLFVNKTRSVGPVRRAVSVRGGTPRLFREKAIDNPPAPQLHCAESSAPIAGGVG